MTQMDAHLSNGFCKVFWEIGASGEQGLCLGDESLDCDGERCIRLLFCREGGECG